MKGILQGRYTKESHEEAVKMVLDVGISLPEAARRLSLQLEVLCKVQKGGKLVDVRKAGES